MVLYDPKTNSLIGKSASEGEKSGMPNEQKEFDAQMQQFKDNGQSVVLCLTSILILGAQGPVALTYSISTTAASDGPR